LQLLTLQLFLVAAAAVTAAEQPGQPDQPVPAVRVVTTPVVLVAAEVQRQVLQAVAVAVALARYLMQAAAAQV
jgi:hypothetical protein